MLDLAALLGRIQANLDVILQDFTPDDVAALEAWSNTPLPPRLVSFQEMSSPPYHQERNARAALRAHVRRTLEYYRRRPASSPAGAARTQEERCVLRVLAEAGDELLSQPELAARTDEYLTLSVRTVRPILQRLEKQGLVCRPRGQRSGYALTDQGRLIAAS